MRDLKPPTYSDVLKARKFLRSFLNPTPFLHSPSLSQLTGSEVWIKYENHNPNGAFKIRGGLYRLSKLSEEERQKGVITASTGNHGQSVAYAGKEFGIRSVISVPEVTSTLKVDAMRTLGGEVILHGETFEDARLHAESLIENEGLTYIHYSCEPEIVAGVGTYCAEMLEDQPDLEAIIVPTGGGSGACGCITVRDALNPSLEIYSVQAESSPAVYRSWKEGKPVEAPNKTLAEGVATGTVFEFPLKILKEGLSDFFLVSENEIKESILHYLIHTRNLVEAAGATPLAALIKNKERFHGKKVGLVISGGNLSIERLREILKE